MEGQGCVFLLGATFPCQCTAGSVPFHTGRREGLRRSCGIFPIGQRLTHPHCTHTHTHLRLQGQKEGGSTGLVCLFVYVRVPVYSRPLQTCFVLQYMSLTEAVVALSFSFLSLFLDQFREPRAVR